MKKQKQSGFTIFEGLLIILILTFITGSSYFVFHRNYSSNQMQSASTAQRTQTAVSKYRTYKNNEFNFQFSYPSDWTQASIQSYGLEVTKGSVYTIGFGMNKFGGKFNTPDYQSSDKYSPPAEFNNCHPTDSKGTYFIYTADDVCMAMIGSTYVGGTANLSTNFVTLTIQKKLKNSKSNALVFTANEFTISGFSQAQLKDVYDKGFTARQKVDYLYLAKSIKELN